MNSNDQFSNIVFVISFWYFVQLFSALFNAALIGLLHNGIALRTTPFAYEFAAIPSGGIKLYPTKKEFGFEVTQKKNHNIF